MKNSPGLSILAALFLPLAGISSEEESNPDILGYLEPYKTITVSAGESGVITEMLVEEGAQTTKGQILARLDTAALQAELDIARAEAKLQGTRCKRLEELAAASRSSPEELERARTDLTIKDAQIRKIEAQIESRTMRSPVDGVVTEIKRDLSEAVSAANPHVLTVVRVDRLICNLFLPPQHATKLRVGTTTPLRLLDESATENAKIEFISPITDSASGTVRVKFVIENLNGNHRSGSRCTLAE